MLLYADRIRGIVVEYNQDVPNFIVVIQYGLNGSRFINECDQARIRIVFTNPQVSNIPLCTDVQVNNILFGEQQSTVTIGDGANGETDYNNVCKAFVLKNTHHWELNDMVAVDILDYGVDHGRLQTCDHYLTKRLLPKMSDFNKMFELNTKGFNEITLLTVTSPILQ